MTELLILVYCESDFEFELEEEEKIDDVLSIIVPLWKEKKNLERGGYVKRSSRVLTIEVLL